jgi:hypothetical protein
MFFPTQKLQTSLMAQFGYRAIGGRSCCVMGLRM